MYENIRVSSIPPPPYAPLSAPPPRRTDGPKMKSLASSQIGISNITICLAPLVKVHANGYYLIKGHCDIP